VVVWMRNSRGWMRRSGGSLERTIGGGLDLEKSWW
jgi:hypothetical protein